jgi:uncharacterized membrane protein YdjX (TVP38/TMEM64 family)
MQVRSMTSRRPWRLYALVFVLVAGMLISMLVVGDALDERFSGEEGLHRLRSYGDWAWMLAIALIVSDLVLPVPGTAVITGLGMLYGPWLGGVIGTVGSVLAGLTAYGGCRFLGNGFVRLLVGDADLHRLDHFFARHGALAIALSRWLPILPEALCCLAGISRMRFGVFLAALVCGGLPMSFLLAALGRAFEAQPLVGLIVSGLLPLLFWPLVQLALRDRQRLPTAS